MSLLHGLNYLHRSIIIFFGLLLLIYLLLTGISPEAFSYETIKRLVFLYGVLQICEFYRQRFYLDWRSEWGFHWRAGILHLAKWPYTLMAFYEVVINRKMPYQLTYKVKTKSIYVKMFLPHLLVTILICISSIINLFFYKTTHPAIYLSASILMIGSLIPLLTSHINFPDPFDKNLVKLR